MLVSEHPDARAPACCCACQRASSPMLVGGAATRAGLLRSEHAVAVALAPAPAAANGSMGAAAAPAQESMCMGPVRLHAIERVGAQLVYPC